VPLQLRIQGQLIFHYHALAMHIHHNLLQDWAVPHKVFNEATHVYASIERLCRCLFCRPFFVSWDKFIVTLWESKRCSKDMGKFQRPRDQFWKQWSWSLESEHIVFAKMTKEWSRKNAMIKVLVLCYIQFSPGIKCWIKTYSWRRGWKVYSHV